MGKAGQTEAYPSHIHWRTPILVNCLALWGCANKLNAWVSAEWRAEEYTVHYFYYLLFQEYLQQFGYLQKPLEQFRGAFTEEEIEDAVR